jgi:aspartate aminotransferase
LEQDKTQTENIINQAKISPVMLSERIHLIKPSATLVMDSLAKKLQQEGIDVINLTAGEPDFDTPRNIKEAAIQTISKGNSRYTPVSGIPELKEAICAKFARENKIDYSPSEIMASSGAKHVLYNAMQALVSKGDEVIIPSPYWVSYADQVQLAEGTPIFAQTENFNITSDFIEQAITRNTKLLILNSPANPTGAVIGKAELKKIADLAIEHNLIVLSDEVYEKYIYDGTHISIASLGEEIKRHTLTINSVSKTYAMTGWRIGYAGGDSKIIGAMTSIQSHSTSNPSSIALSYKS